MQIILYPAQVQGEGAVSSIIKGIRALEKKKVDVIIVGRGGGSIEDLWAFNEEPVARAIFECSVPVISRSDMRQTLRLQTMSLICGHRLLPRRRNWPYMNTAR